MKPTVLLDMTSLANETMRIKTLELARQMAERDAHVLRGCDVLVHEFETTRRWKLDNPVVARVIKVTLEEKDDYIDMRVRVRFTDWVKGEMEGSMYGRSYEVSPKEGAW
jgi:hypothetical protein